MQHTQLADHGWSVYTSATVWGRLHPAAALFLEVADSRFADCAHVMVDLFACVCCLRGRLSGSAVCLSLPALSPMTLLICGSAPLFAFLCVNNRACTRARMMWPPRPGQARPQRLRMQQIVGGTSSSGSAALRLRLQLRCREHAWAPTMQPAGQLPADASHRNTCRHIARNLFQVSQAAVEACLGVSRGENAHRPADELAAAIAQQSRRANVACTRAVLCWRAVRSARFATGAARAVPPGHPLGRPSSAVPHITCCTASGAAHRCSI